MNRNGLKWQTEMPPAEPVDEHLQLIGATLIMTLRMQVIEGTVRQPAISDNENGGDSPGTARRARSPCSLYAAQDRGRNLRQHAGEAAASALSAAKVLHALEIVMQGTIVFGSGFIFFTR